MKPEYLEELADIADPDGLWRLSGIDQTDLSPEKRKQLDAGVALRRYSSHVKQLHQALSDRRSYLITPLSALGQIAKMIDTPADHAAYRDRRKVAEQEPATVEESVLSQSAESVRDWLGGGCKTEPPRPAIALLAATAEAVIEVGRTKRATQQKVGAAQEPLRQHVDEIESLRRGQAAAVMPLIGPMENAPAIGLRAAPQDASKAPDVHVREVADRLLRQFEQSEHPREDINLSDVLFVCASILSAALPAADTVQQGADGQR